VMATDTMADLGTAEFSAGVGLLLHEAWYDAAAAQTGEMPAELPPGFAAHSEAGSVARLAAAADVGRLVLIHLNPAYDETYYAAMAATARAAFPRTEVRGDGEAVDTSRSV
jgi:ribonuclease Z